MVNFYLKINLNCENIFNGVLRENESAFIRYPMKQKDPMLIELIGAVSEIGFLNFAILDLGVGAQLTLKKI